MTKRSSWEWKVFLLSGWLTLTSLSGCSKADKFNGRRLDPLIDKTSIAHDKQKCHQPNYLKVGPQGILLEVTLRDFSSNFADFENFNSKKPHPSIEDCGSLDQVELSDVHVKESYLRSLRDRFPQQFLWATSNSREIYPTFGMLKSELGTDGLPQKGRHACHNEHIDKWFRDMDGINFRVQDQLELKPVGEDTYQVEFFHFNNNSYLPLDKFSESKTNQTWGRQNHATWCMDDRDACKKRSDDQGQSANSVPNGSNFGFTMTTKFDFVYNSHYGEYFEFDGDDDYWLFIDGKLVIDAGGTHVLVHSRVSLDSLAQDRGWLDGSTHNTQLFFAERQADASNLSMKFKTKGILDINEIPPYIYRSYQLSQEEDPKYLLYLNTPLDEVSIDKIQKNLERNVFIILDEQDEDISQDMKVVSFQPLADSLILSRVQAQAVYEIQFENSDETRFVAPSLGHKISFNPNASISIQSSQGLKVTDYHHASVMDAELMKQEEVFGFHQNECHSIRP